MSTTPYAFPLALADDALVAGHRLSEWSSKAHVLEEDIALSNLALDLIGQARLFYAYAAELEGVGRSEDDLAYFRDAAAYRNLLIVEIDNGDFAQTMMRHYLYAAFAHPYFEVLARSTDERLAEIAAKAVKEMGYHVRHSAEWVIRLGDGTDESHRRMMSALDYVWSFTGEMFEMDEAERALVTAGIAPDRESLRAPWTRAVDAVLGEATLTRPAARRMLTGGRSGRHGEALDHMLAEMQVLARQHPGATW